MRFVFLSTVATVIAFLPRPASACSRLVPPSDGGICAPTVVVRSTTASAPAIPLSVYGAQVFTFRLLTASGEVVVDQYTKDKWQDRGTPILAFASPPAPGDYQLEYSEGCPNGVPTKPAIVTRSPLTITAAAPTPISTGTFTTENRSIEDGQIWTYSGACYVSMKYVKLDVVFHTSAELEPFRQVSGYQIKIDGRANDAVAPPESGTSKDIPLALHAACDGDDRQTGGLALGTHTVSVVWHAAGAGTDFPEATTTIDLTCENASTPSGADAGTSSASATDAGEGCSTTGRTPISAAVFAFFAFFGVLACRRNAASHQHRSRRNAA